MQRNISMDAAPGEPIAAQASPDRAGLTLALLAVALAVCTCVATFRIMWICYSPVPIGDMWDFWAWSQRYGSGALWHLAAQHNEHRIAVPRLFFLFDQYFCSGTAVSLAIFIPLILLAHGVILCRLAALVPGIRRTTAWFMGALAMAAMFSSQQFANFTWYFQIQFAEVYFGASLCCVLLPGIRSASAARENNRRLALIIILAVATTYCVANGLLIWPVLLSLSYLLGFSRRLRATLLAFGIATWIAYFIGYVRPADHASPLEALRHLPAFLGFLVTVIGSPFADPIAFCVPGAKLPDVIHCAGIVGCVGLLAAFLFLLNQALHVTRLRGAFNRRTDLVYLHLLVFELCSVGLIASGRFNFPIEEALTSRYTTPAMLFWLFLTSLLVIAAGRSENKRTQSIGLVLRAAMLVAFVFFLTTDQAGKVAYARGYELYLNESEIAIANDVYDAPVWKRVHYYNMNTVRSLTNYFRTDDLSVYHKQWRGWLGGEIAKHYAVEGTCQGSVDLVRTISGSDRPGYRMEGWAWDGELYDSRRHLLLTDPEGHILGSAIDGFPRPDVARSLHNPGTLKTGWVGYLPGPEHSRVDVYLILPHGRRACLIGSRDVSAK